MGRVNVNLEILETRMKGGFSTMEDEIIKRHLEHQGFNLRKWGL